MIKVKTFTFNPFQENTYVVYNETGDAAIIDPGCYDKEEKKELSDFIASENLKVKYLLNTHCHVDHVLGNRYIKEFYKVELYIHSLDEPVLRSVKNYAPVYGFHMYEEAEPNHFLQEGDILNLGNSKLEVLFLPGHAPGHVAFYNREQNLCLAGDVLFYRSIGRTDLPGGDHDTLISSIQNKLFALPDKTVIFPGHGPVTNIGDEKKLNPFCAIP